MSNQSLFFQSISTLYHHRCATVLDYLLEETEGLVAQIQYQKQIQAPFWHLLLRADGTVVQLCRNLAGYFGEAPQSMANRSLWSFLMPDQPGQAQDLTRQAHDLATQVLETGQAVTHIFSTRYGGQCGVVCCRVPWLQEQLGDLVALFWPLTDEEAQAAFAFRSFDGLRTSMLLDTQGHVLVIDPILAQRLGTTPQMLAGQCIFERFPPDKVRQRWVSFQDVAWTGQPREWTETGDVGVCYDNYMLPVFGRNGHVVRVLALAREHGRAFVEAQVAEQVHVVE